jgi:hypothetical protein
VHNIFYWKDRASGLWALGHIRKFRELVAIGVLKILPEEIITAASCSIITLGTLDPVKFTLDLRRILVRR